MWTLEASVSSFPLLKENSAIFNSMYKIGGIMLSEIILILRNIYWLTGKDPDAGKDWRQEEKGMTEDKMVGWHYWLDGHEFEQVPGVGNGQGSLVCCSPWGSKKSDMTVTELTNILPDLGRIKTPGNLGRNIQFWSAFIRTKSSFSQVLRPDANLFWPRLEKNME